MAPFSGRSSHKRQQSSTSANSRSSINASKIEVTINVYDLLPPGRVSTVLWSVGSGLLHSGVVIGDREYAYGGHNRRGVTGVYWTRPRQDPPGGRFRSDILQGFTFRTEAEIAAIIKEVSEQFLGPSYNLLTRNCNHFTSALCEALTSKAAPSWLNRAASIGLAMPCMVPKEWITPPDAETAEGELLETEAEESDDDIADERAGMIDDDRRQERRREAGRNRYSKDRDRTTKDVQGRELPVAERAPA